MRGRITYANAMSTLAVFVALGGGAYAAATIGSNDIQSNAVLSKHVAKDTLKGGDIKESSLRGVQPLAYAHVVDGSIVKKDSLRTTQVADNVTANYCFKVVGKPEHVQVTVDGDLTYQNAMATLDPTLCPAGTEAQVETGDADGSFHDRDFFVLFY